MSQYDGELTEVYPVEEEDRHAELMGDSDYEDDEHGQSISKVTEDISAMDVKKGKDIQGIPWERMSITRDRYRQTRVEQYANFENIPNSGRTSEKHTSLSPDGKLAAIVDDNPDGLLVYANSGKTVHDLRGHLDYSFASAWNPDGRTFATGNQDKTCRIWDTRNLSMSVAVLGGNIGAIMSIRYTADGKFLAMAEPADFIHIVDVESGYSRKQELDFFGEIADMEIWEFLGCHRLTTSMTGPRSDL